MSTTNAELVEAIKAAIVRNSNGVEFFREGDDSAKFSKVSDLANALKTLSSDDVQAGSDDSSPCKLFRHL